MYRNKKILGLIVCKEKSRGLKNKHLLKINKKECIVWTFQSSVKSRYLDKIILSTDSKKIIKLSNKFKKIISPFRRPASLCRDSASISGVINHALKKTLKKKNEFDYFMLLQGTSPLRTSTHIDNAIKHYFKYFKNDDECTLVSCFKLDFKFNWIMSSNKKKRIKFILKQKNIKNLQRQNLNDTYLPNGAIYIANIKKFKSTFYGNKTILFEMAKKDSIDIDNIDDLIKANEYLKRKF
tara:strand:- start:325 stop:1038 length:714 start_codon:yes stop_codon:yes gene_type:complete